MWKSKACEVGGGGGVGERDGLVQGLGRHTGKGAREDRPGEPAGSRMSPKGAWT